MSSKVYFIKASLKEGHEAISQKSVKLFKAGNFSNCFKAGDFTAVKVHIGEAGNNTHLPAPCIKGLVKEMLALKTKPFLTDTSTLYMRRRHNALDHSILAAEHGFDIAGLGIPFIAPDGLFGTSEIPVQINGQLNDHVLIADGIVRSQSILSIAHFTGHIETCAAATLKTLGMGCASRKGKMRQHASLKPTIGDDCTLCGECFKHCPSDAITLGDIKAHIDQDKCIGCAECLAVCRFGAVKHDWGVQSEILQKNVAEHALGAVKEKEGRAVFFNYIISVTKDCDCFDVPDVCSIIEDVGIAVSTDPVAVDKASVDLAEKAGAKKMGQLVNNAKLDPNFQLRHAESIGLGSVNYELIEIN